MLIWTEYGDALRIKPPQISSVLHHCMQLAGFFSTFWRPSRDTTNAADPSQDTSQEVSTIFHMPVVVLPSSCSRSALPSHFETRDDGTNGRIGRTKVGLGIAIVRYLSHHADSRL